MRLERNPTALQAIQGQGGQVPGRGHQLAADCAL
jgi:hypothetical protein